MAKGAGMLAPALATMLCVLTTDADLTADELDSALRSATAVTFDRLDTDGCMSTNDTVLLMASGASGVKPDKKDFTRAADRGLRRPRPPAAARRRGRLEDVTIEVVGAASEADAVTVGRAWPGTTCSSARSPARTRTGAGCCPRSAPPTRSSTRPAQRGDERRLGLPGGAPGDDRSKVDLKGGDVTITVDLSAGPHGAVILTTDLTEAYVHENSAYST